jgi:DNA repair exonuclease SbcCD ATPase subunit
MTWVIAVLAVGCLFFIFQIVVDYIKYQAVIAPRIRQLEETKQELEGKIQKVRATLDEKRGKLEPLKKEIERLEEEYLNLQQQIEAVRTARKPPPSWFGKKDNGPVEQ